jgi:hypothetical protein
MRATFQLLLTTSFVFIVAFSVAILSELKFGFADYYDGNIASCTSQTTNCPMHTCTNKMLVCKKDGDLCNCLL